MELNSTSLANQGRQIRIFHGIIKDTLMVNSDPQVITTFYYDEAPVLTSILPLPPSNHTTFIL
jgi:hypothetical protein